ncbi:membrane fusion protein, multidrug efflux system [Microbulbifer donghaiensis]|uniref:Membrane fusion protein, multidrug efflux system n=1 Tax=Microbulbifer donghaiensis TaxID=494016 RepID=A0A1M4ZMK0_9GAMM|nr:HlyD family secretion protein [Microbulbifer donghaiensis]SHF19231.1 membrane fusion protein, multidrug efflux system [Microbulbifer donghaiensis]
MKGKLGKVAGKITVRRLGFLAGILVAVSVTGWCLFGGRSIVETENAYIKADKISLAPEVSGVVIQVLVRANQPVEKGQLLVQLDTTPFELAVAEAEGHLGQVRNELLARRADYAEAEAALQQARQDADFYRRQLARNEKLGKVAVSEAQLDESRQQLERARAQIAINTEKLSSLRAELGGNPEFPLEEQADLKVAQAQLDKARYQLSRTRIMAPVNGVIANTVPQAGEMAPAGIGLISMLGADGIWVEANLKETELERVRTGQQAEVTLDAYPNFRWQAQVDSLSPASGSEFALIPPQNASGNWVKVVQRVPVRLRLLPAKDAPALRAGMSARVRIDTSEDDKLVAARTSGGESGRVVLAP